MRDGSSGRRCGDTYTSLLVERLDDEDKAARANLSDGLPENCSGHFRSTIDRFTHLFVNNIERGLVDQANV